MVRVKVWTGQIGSEPDILVNTKIIFNILKEVEKSIKEKINDKGFKIDFEFVSYLSPTKSGKPQIIESFLKNG